MHNENKENQPNKHETHIMKANRIKPTKKTKHT